LGFLVVAGGDVAGRVLDIWVAKGAVSGMQGCRKLGIVMWVVLACGWLVLGESKVEGQDRQDRRSGMDAVPGLGYAAMAPADMDAFFSLSKLWGLAEAAGLDGGAVMRLAGGLLAGAAGELGEYEELGGAVAELLGPILWKQMERVIGEELFIGLGAGGAEQVALWSRLGEVVNVARVEAALVTVDGGESMGSLLEVLEGRREEILGLMGGLEVPPLLFGLRAEDPAGTVEWLAKTFGGEALFRELLPEAKVETFEDGGGRFVSVRVGLELFLPLLEGSEWWGNLGREDRGQVRGYLGALGGKELEFVVGYRGDYVLLGLGAGREQLALAGSVQESLALRPAMGLARRLVAGGKVPAALGYRSAELQAAAARPQLPALLEGMWRALSGHPAFAGMAAQMEGRIREAAGRDLALYGREFTDAAGLIFLEGRRLRLEERGGAAWPWEIEAEGPVKFGRGLAGGRVFAAAWREDREKNVEAMGHLAAVAGLAVEMVGSYLGMIEGGEGVVGVWRQLREGAGGTLGQLGGGLAEVFGRGVGDERLFALDFGGVVPALPGMPEGLAGKLPLARFAMVHDVVERGRISGGGAKVGEAFGPLREGLGEAGGGLGQLLLKVQDGGLSSYFLGLPFWTPDLMPSIAVGDEHYLWSSSRSLSRELVAQTATAELGEADGMAGTELMVWRLSGKALAEAAGRMADALADARGLPPELFLAVGRLEAFAAMAGSAPSAGGRIFLNPQGVMRRSAWIQFGGKNDVAP